MNHTESAAESALAAVEERLGDPETRLEELLPHLSVDCAILGFHAGELKILLLRWHGADSWSLPGGYIRRDESLDQSAHRVLRERTGLERIYLQQFRAFGAIHRGEEALRAVLALRGIELPADLWIFQRVVSIGYLALVDFAEAVPTPDILSEEARWWDIRSRPRLLFDHDEIVESALEALRSGLEHKVTGQKLLPEKFTMPELQQFHEAVLGVSLDRRNFQRKMLDLGIVERLEERKHGVPHRAPYLYRFREQSAD